MLRVTTEIGYFVVPAWVTEGIRPGVVACSHHMGRWRVADDQGTDRWSSALVRLEERGDGRWRMRRMKGVEPFESDDRDSGRVWWQSAGVHQNLTFAVHPDPISGAHAWHQKVRVTKAEPGDQEGDVVVDTARSHAVYKEWLAKARPAPGPVECDGRTGSCGRCGRRWRRTGFPVRLIVTCSERIRQSRRRGPGTRRQVRGSLRDREEPLPRPALPQAVEPAKRLDPPLPARHRNVRPPQVDEPSERDDAGECGPCFVTTLDRDGNHENTRNHHAGYGDASLCAFAPNVAVREPRLLETRVGLRVDRATDVIEAVPGA